MISDIGYVLHKSAWKDSSELIRLFTCHHGRVDVIAKGSKRILIKGSAISRKLKILPGLMVLTGKLLNKKWISCPSLQIPLRL